MKNKNTSVNTLINGMIIGTALTLVAEGCGLYVGKPVISSIIEGKKIEMDEVEELQKEYQIVEDAYNYYSKGGTVEYFCGDFQYPIMENQYEEIESAGKKEYLKKCLDQKVIEYTTENPEVTSLDMEQLYEEALWEIVEQDSSYPHAESGFAEEKTEEKLLEMMESRYGFLEGKNYTDYHNLELNEEETKAVEFVKRRGEK